MSIVVTEERRTCGEHNGDNYDTLYSASAYLFKIVTIDVWKVYSELEIDEAIMHEDCFMFDQAVYSPNSKNQQIFLSAKNLSHLCETDEKIARNDSDQYGASNMKKIEYSHMQTEYSEVHKISRNKEIYRHKYNYLKPQKEIEATLINHATNLSQGRYKQTQGVSCSVIVGAKGIGKTYALKMVAKSVKSIAPRVYVIYISYKNMNDTESVLRSQSLSRILLALLSGTGMEVDEAYSALPEKVIRALIQHEYYLLVIVDDFDQLYTLNGNEYGSALSTLSDLSYFSNQPSGRISVVLCSSTFYAADLISASASASVDTSTIEQLRQTYPLLSSGAIDLNNTKYPVKVINCILPVDLEAVASIMEPDIRGKNICFQRLLAYVSGCIDREIKMTLSGELVDSLWTRVALEKKTKKIQASFAKKLMRKLFTKNRSLLMLIFGRGQKRIHEVIQSIAKVAWETMFVYLVYEEVEELWNKATAKKGMFKMDYQISLSSCMLNLAELCIFKFEGHPSRPRKLYPFSMASMEEFILSEKSRNELREELMKVIKLSTEEFEEFIATEQKGGQRMEVVNEISGYPINRVFRYFSP